MDAQQFHRALRASAATDLGTHDRDLVLSPDPPWFAYTSRFPFWPDSTLVPGCRPLFAWPRSARLLRHAPARFGSVFDEAPLILNNNHGQQEIFIDNPENIQLYHVKNIKEHLLGVTEHPSTGYTATHTSWVMDKILGRM